MLIALWLDNRAVKPMFYHTDKHGGSALRRATEPAVRVAVKTKLSYRNDTKISCFVAATRSKDNAKVDLASSKS